MYSIIIINNILWDATYKKHSERINKDVCIVIFMCHKLNNTTTAVIKQLYRHDILQLYNKIKKILWCDITAVGKEKENIYNKKTEKEIVSVTAQLQ